MRLICLIWLANAEKGNGEVEEWDWGMKDKDKDKRKLMGIIAGLGGRPPMIRTQSKSKVELNVTLQAQNSKPAFSLGPTTMPSKPLISSSPSKRTVVRHASSGTEERWVYKRKMGRRGGLRY